MPSSDAQAPYTITAYRYQEEGSSRYYEVGVSAEIWAMTTLA